MYLGVAGVLQGLHEGFPFLLMLRDKVVRSGIQGADISLRKAIFLWIIGRCRYVLGFEAGKRVLEVSRSEPLLDSLRSDMPYAYAQYWRNASVTTKDVAELRGIALVNLGKRSVTTTRCLWLDLYLGKGPSKPRTMVERDSLADKSLCSRHDLYFVPLV